MKRLKLKVEKRLSLTLLLFFSFVMAFPSTLHETPFPIEGVWDNIMADGGSRSLSSIPFQAYTDGHSVYVYNSAPDCDINVSIINNVGDEVFHSIIPMNESAYFMLPIDDLPSGRYTLVLSNPDRREVYGQFSIE